MEFVIDAARWGKRCATYFSDDLEGLSKEGGRNGVYNIFKDACWWFFFLFFFFMNFNASNK